MTQWSSQVKSMIAFYGNTTYSHEIVIKDKDSFFFIPFIKEWVSSFRATGLDRWMACRPQRELLFPFPLRLSDFMVTSKRVQATVGAPV